MRYLYLILTCMIPFFPGLATTEWEPSLSTQMKGGITAAINSPNSGQVVQGGVVVIGSTTQDGFLAYEVDFAYPADPTQTWFLIQESTSPIQDGILAVWDTSTIRDGDYTLRLLVSLTNGDHVEVSVPDIRVRNYSAVETDTPTPIPFSEKIAPGIPSSIPTPLTTTTPITILLSPAITPLPTNSAKISSAQVLLTFGKGAIFTLGFFTLLGVYLGIRTILYNRK